MPTCLRDSSKQSGDGKSSLSLPPDVQKIIVSSVGFVLLWNSGFIGAEYVLPNVGPLTLLFWRYWALFAILAMWLVIRGRLSWPGGNVVAHSCLLGLLAHGTWLGCVIYALKFDVPAGLVALVVALQPLLTNALSRVIAFEPTSRLQWLGSIIGFTGVVLTVGVRIDFTQTESIVGYALPFISVIAITLASLLERRHEKMEPDKLISLDLSLFYQSLAVAVAVSLPAFYFEGLKTQLDAPFALSMLWLILGVSLGAYALMWRLIERLDAKRVANLFYLGPPVTMFMAWVAFGDTVTRGDIIGFSIVIVGVIIADLAPDQPADDQTEIG